MCGCCGGRMIMIVYSVLFILLAIGWAVCGIAVKDENNQDNNYAIKGVTASLMGLSIGISVVCIINIFCNGPCCIIICLVAIIAIVITIWTLSVTITFLIKTMLSKGLEKIREKAKKDKEEAQQPAKPKGAKNVDIHFVVDKAKSIRKQITAELADQGDVYLEYAMYAVIPVMCIAYALPAVALICQCLTGD